jgi:hypothetical protein
MLYLEHWMPGRARLRVPKPHSAAHVNRIARILARTKQIRNVDANPKTGSLLVSFDADDPIDLIIDGIRLAGIEVANAMHASRSTIRSQTTSAALVGHVLGRANTRLHLMSRGHVDLRLAVPAFYLALAARNFVRGRGRLRDASWYQLLYWAFDSFIKLHQEVTVAESSRSHGRLVT